LEGGPLLAKEFVAWSKGYVLFNHITTHIPDAPYDDLLDEKGGLGFPFLVFMDAEGKVLAEHEGARDVAGFQQTGKKLLALAALQKKFDGGDESVGYDLLVAQLELALQPIEEVERRVQDLGELAPKQNAKLDPLVTTNEARGLYLITRKPDPATNDAAIDRAGAMYQAGRVPGGNGSEVTKYWILVGAFAESKRDAAMLETALTAIRPLAKAHPELQPWIDDMDARLAKMKGVGR